MSNDKTSLTLSVRRTRKPGLRTNVNTAGSIKDTGGLSIRQTLGTSGNLSAGDAGFNAGA